MDRKDLIRLYLDAEATCGEERALAESFATTPPANEEEQAVFQMMRAVKPVPMTEVPEAGDEYDRIVRKARRRTIRNWSLAVSGIAAVLVAVALLTGKPDPQQPGETDSLELLQQLQFISHLDPADAASYEFTPVGDGFIMTAHFANGGSASYILTLMEDEQSFQLISLNNQQEIQ